VSLRSQHLVKPRSSRTQKSQEPLSLEPSSRSLEPLSQVAKQSRVRKPSSLEPSNQAARRILNLPEPIPVRLLATYPSLVMPRKCENSIVMFRIYVTSLVMPRMYETFLMMLRIYATTLVMPRSWTHQVMVLDQQLYKFQKYETILWSEMTVCTPGETSVLHVTVQRGKMAVSLSPREMTVLELDLSLRLKQVSHPGYGMKEEDSFSLFFSVPRCSSAAHC